MKRTHTATPASIHADAVATIRRLRMECIRKGKGAGTPEIAVVDRLMKAIQSLPAFELAEQAVRDVGESGLPAAVIRKLGGRWGEPSTPAEDLQRGIDMVMGKK